MCFRYCSLIGASFGFLPLSFFFDSLGFILVYYKQQNIEKSSLYLKLTMLGGVLFLVLKSIEYISKIETGLTINYNIFFTFYWLLTLFHVIHVIVGLVIIGSIYLGINKKNATTNLEDVEASAAFWHMCDLIWLLLFPIIYLLF